MKSSGRTSRYFKFCLYVIIVVLLNIAGASFFLRADLTSDNIFSLSDASKDALGKLSGPMTVKVFFTKNLPPPYNATESYLHDLLSEYALYGRKYFNYQFYNVTPQQEGSDGSVAKNQSMAMDYGIYPVQVRNIVADEVKFQKAYMGLVIIYGNMVEKLDSIYTTDGLEYRITTAVRKLVNKVSAFSNLDGHVKATLYLSSSLYSVAPYLGLDNLPRLPETVKQVVDDLNSRLFDAISFEIIDPSALPDEEAGIKGDDLLRLEWPEIARGKEKPIPAGKGVVGMLLEYKGNRQSFPLIKVVRIPIFGTRYSMPDKHAIETGLEQGVETVVGINDNIGYLVGHGTPNLFPFDMSGSFRQEPEKSVANFKALLSQNYTVRGVNLDKDGLGDSFDCLIIAGPTEKFSDYDLFQIDQYLMRGHSVALFLDRFAETYPGGRKSPYSQPVWMPVSTGMEKLLSRYGVEVEQSMVMDESCYKQTLDSNRGQQPIYFAPLVKKAFINNKPAFMKNIKGLVAVKVSPLKLLPDTIKENGIKAVTLFSSSDRSWVSKGRLNLNPIFITPPGPDTQRSSFPLAALLYGKFPSYFAGRDIPVKPVEKDKNAANDKKGEGARDRKNPGGKVSVSGVVIQKGKEGKLFVMGSSQMLRDYMVDREGRSPNAVFLMNLIDTLNNRDDIAVLRSKQQAYNPLDDVSGSVRMFIKWFNIAGLPVLVAVFGLLMLVGRSIRRRRIRRMFAA